MLCNIQSHFSLSASQLQRFNSLGNSEFFGEHDLHNALQENIESSDLFWNSDYLNEPHVETEKDTSPFGCLSWLSSSCVSSTPDFEIVTLSFNKHAIVLKQKPSSRSISEPVFIKCDERICSLYCMPIASTGRSATRLWDWTCIIIGLENGQILFYTDVGVLILSQKYTNSAVRSFHFQQRPQSAQELSILHANMVLVTIEGFSLLTTLKGCRNHVAREGYSVAFSEAVDLNFYKWRLEGGGTAVDHVCGGSRAMNSFTQLENASVLGGFNSSVSRRVPQYTSYIIIGFDPFLRVYWADEAAKQTVSVSQVVHNLAGKVRSAVSAQMPSTLRSVGHYLNPWGGSQERTARARPEDAPPTSLAARFTLPDATRDALRILAAPAEGLAAVTDALGRVCVLDVQRCQIVRMWKGYRDAQCAWVRNSGKVDAAEDNLAVDRSALFLVVYAPRRAIIEVWAMQNGPRVAAFNVGDRNGVLLSAESCLLGGSDDALMECNMSTCLFLSSNGQARTIQIPFLLALQHQSVDSLHDAGVLKEVRGMLNNASLRLAEPIVPYLKLLKTIDGREQALDLLFSSCEAALPCNQLDLCLQIFFDCESTMKSTLDGVRFISQCHLYRQLLNAYALLMRWHNKDEMSDRSFADISDGELATMLHLDARDTVRYMECLQRYAEYVARSNSQSKELFTMKVQDFVSAFDLRTHSDMAGCAEMAEVTAYRELQLKSDVTDDVLCRLGKYLFLPFLLRSDLTVQDLVTHLASLLRLEGPDYLRLFLAAWLCEDHDFTTSPRRVFDILSAIVGNSLSCRSFDWLSQAEDAVVKSYRMPEVFTLTLVLTAVAKTAVISPDSSSNAEPILMHEWDVVSPKLERWDNLTMTLFNFLQLSLLVHDEEHLRDKAKVVQLREMITVQYAVVSGRDFISEMIGKYIASTNCSVQDILFGFGKSRTASRDEAQETSQATTEPVLWQRCLRGLVRCLPLSLSLDNVLANCAWECMALWKENPDDIALFTRSVTFLSDIMHPVLLHGVTILMWRMFVAERFERMCILLEKVGKLPKDRLCRKDVQVADIRLVDFAFCCVKLLQSILHANSQFETSSAASNQTMYEDFVDQFFQLFAGTVHKLASSPTNTRGQTGLIELALRQKCTNYHLVFLHWEVAVVVHLMLEQSLKPAKPLSLFDSKARNALFKSLYTHPLLTTRTEDFDVTLLDARNEFLKQYVTARVDALPMMPDAERRPGIGGTGRLSVRNWLESMHSVVALAKAWQVDLDMIWRHSVSALYLAGHDAVAEQHMHLASNKEALGADLLLVAGEITAPKVLSHSDAVPFLSQRLLSWLRAVQSGSLKYAGYKKSAAQKLLGHVDRLLSPDHVERAILADLLDLLGRVDF